MTQEQTFAQKLASNMVDGLMKQAKQAADQAGEEVKKAEEEVRLDPETLKKIKERELRRLTDPEFALSDEVTMSATERARQERQRMSSGPAAPVSPAAAPKSESQIIEEDRKRRTDEMMAETRNRIDLAKNLYNTCIEAGGTPTQCAKMVADTMEVKRDASAPPATSITDLVNSLKVLDELRGSKTDPALTELLKGMQEEIRNLRTQITTLPTSKVEPVTLKSILKELNETADCLVSLGVVQRPGTEAKTKGDSLDVIKENNHNAIELKKLDLEEKRIEVDKGHKEKLADALKGVTDIVKDGIKEGIEEFAGGGAKETTPPVAQQGPEMVLFKCENLDPATKAERPGCGKQFKIPAGAPKVECPYCHMVYGISQPT